MSRTGTSLQDINGSEPNNLRNIGRQSPRTFVRNADSDTPVREYEIPIRLTGANAPVTTPQSISSRFPSTGASTPAEKVPFLPSSTYSKTTDYPYNSDFDRPRSPTEGGPDRLALVDDMADHKHLTPTWQSKLADKTRLRNNLVREFLAEFLGSFILIVFGNGAVAEVVLSTRKPGGPVNDFFSINVAYGLAVGFGVYIAGGVSGGHLNPAVTLAFALKGATKWIAVPIYWLAQYLGCFIGSAVIYMIYYNALDAHDGGVRITDPGHANATAGIFASYPQPYLSWQGGLVDQIFGTSFLMIGILALTDPRNTAPHKGTVPLLVALLVMVIGLSYGYNCGYPINPARDLGPRIFTSIAGWGLAPFQFNNHNWFWVPVIGPHLGAILGLGIYQIFIGNHWSVQQRTGIELQVVRRGNPPDEYQLVKAAHVMPGDVNVPVTFRTNDPATEKLLAVR